MDVSFETVTNFVSSGFLLGEAYNEEKYIARIEDLLKILSNEIKYLNPATRKRPDSETSSE